MGQSLSMFHKEQLDNDDNLTYISSIYRNSIEDLAKDFSIGVFLEKEQTVNKMWKNLLQNTNLSFQQDFSLKKTNEKGEQIVLETPLIKEQKRMKEKHFFLASKQDFLIARLFYSDPKYFPLLVELGPPSELRWSTWKMILLQNFKVTQTYEQMLEKQNEKQEQMINKDIYRTLVTHKFFKGQFGQQQLYRILKGISLYFPESGYCQGMNFLGGFLLMVSGCDEALSFQTFVSLFIDPKYLFYFIYAKDFKLLQLLQFYIKTLLQEMNPKLYQHFNEQNIHESYWLTKMILCMFLSLFSIQNCLRFWDYIIAKGMIGIVELVLSILDVMNDKLLIQDFEQMLNTFSNQMLNDDNEQLDINSELCLYLCKDKYQLKKKKLVEMTRLYLKEKQQLERRDIDLEIIFLQYENKQIFEEKMKEYLKKIRL